MDVRERAEGLVEVVQRLTVEPRVRQSEVSGLDTVRQVAETNAFLARANGNLAELELLRRLRRKPLGLEQEAAE